MSGMLNASQKRTKRAPFTEALMSSVPARCAGWLATMPTGPAAEPGEADDDVPARSARAPRGSTPSSAIAWIRVEHVVRLVRRRRNQPVERLVFAIDRIVGRDARRIVEVVVGHERQQLANQRDALGVVLHGEVRDAALLVVRHRAAEIFLA